MQESGPACWLQADRDERRSAGKPDRSMLRIASASKRTVFPPAEHGRLWIVDRGRGCRPPVMLRLVTLSVVISLC